MRILLDLATVGRRITPLPDSKSDFAHENAEFEGFSPSCRPHRCGIGSTMLRNRNERRSQELGVRDCHSAAGAWTSGWFDRLWLRRDRTARVHASVPRHVRHVFLQALISS